MQIKRKILPVLAAAMLFCMMFTGMAFAEPVNGAQSQNSQIQAGGTILMVVDSNTGRVKANYRLEDFYNLGFDNTFPLDNSNKDTLVFQKFSGTSSVYYTAWYGVVGVTLEYLLRDLGIWDTFTEVTFISEDSTYAYLKADDIKKGQKYYYEDSDKEIATVYPMIGFWYTESAVNVFTDPVEPTISATYMHENAPRLFYGQGSYLEDGNRGEFVKNISTIYVDFPPDELYKVPPTIKGIPGDMYLKKGQTFNYPEGVTAVDAYGSTVKNLVRTTTDAQGSDTFVNTDQPGVYTVTYTATDERGNVSNASFKVYVTDENLQKGFYAVNIAAGGDYTVLNNSGEIASLKMTAAGVKTVSFKVGVTPVKKQGSSQTVVFCQYRGNKLVGISSQTMNISDTKNLFGSFAMEQGDVVKVFVVDKLGSVFGSTTTILNQ